MFNVHKSYYLVLYVSTYLQGENLFANGMIAVVTKVLVPLPCAVLKVVETRLMIALHFFHFDF